MRRHRAVVLIAVLAGVGWMGWCARHLRLDNSLEVWFVDKDPSLVSYRNFLEKFGNDEVVVIAIHGNGTVYDADRLARLLDLTENLQLLDGVERVRSLANTLVRGHHGEPLPPIT